LKLINYQIYFGTNMRDLMFRWRLGISAVPELTAGFQVLPG